VHLVTREWQYIQRQVSLIVTVLICESSFPKRQRKQVGRASLVIEQKPTTRVSANTYGSPRAQNERAEKNRLGAHPSGYRFPRERPKQPNQRREGRSLLLVVGTEEPLMNVADDGAEPLVRDSLAVLAGHGAVDVSHAGVDRDLVSRFPRLRLETVA